MNTVAHTFDPYHKWLGIAPKDQPANHYRLLGIDLFESDPDTISNAADRQMAHVRSFQTGQNSDVSQRILNEIAAARVCLLDPTKKFAYDVGLKEALRPVVAPVVNQRPVSKMNTQMALLILGAASVGVLAVVLLLSRSKPTVARPPVAEKPAQTREAPPPKPSNEEEPEPKPKPEPKPQAPPEPEPKPETDVKPKDKTEDATNEDSQRKSEGPREDTSPKSETPRMIGTGLPSGAVLIFTFDKSSVVRRGENLYVRDLSGHGNDGLVSGTQLVTGCVGTGISIAGPADYVECPDNKSLNPSAFTICTWVKERSRQGGYFVSKEDWEGGGDRGYVLRCGQLNRVVDLTIGGGVWQEVRSDIGLELGRWHHVAATYDGKQTAVFVNGVKRGSTALKRPIAHSRYNLRIGGGTFDKNRTLDGTLDELAIFGRALTEAEIQSVYQMGLNGKGLQWRERGDSDTARLPIPDQASQDKACSQVKELFDADHTAAKGSSEKLSALASKLLEKAQEATDEASQYVLLDFAKTFSVEAGNAALAMRAIDQIGDRFQCDVLVLKVECIAACAKAARTSEQTTTLLTTIEPIIQASLAEADFDTAKNLSRVAVELARKIRDSATLKRLAATNREIEDLERQYYRDVKPAMEVLKRTPEDPTANFVVGKYLSLRGNWEKGLPMLTLGSDSELKSLATADLKSPTDGSEQKRLADEWWNFASKHEEFRASARQRASEWYRKALPVLTGLEKEVATKRIAETEGGNDGDGTVVKRIRFSSPESLKAFLPTSALQVAIRNGTVVLGANTGARRVPLVYNGYFEEIKSVRIVGGIVPPAKGSFRMSVGPVSMILNWENADENHFRCVDGGRSGVVRPHVLVPGKFHEIVVQQDGDKAVVSVDGKSLYTCVTKLNGAISIYTYKSAIAVREIVVEGKVDPNKKVTGPSHNNVF
jgi:hypothetical protein